MNTQILPSIRQVALITFVFAALILPQSARAQWYGYEQYGYEEYGYEEYYGQSAYYEQPTYYYQQPTYYYEEPWYGYEPTYYYEQPTYNYYQPFYYEQPTYYQQPTYNYYQPTYYSGGGVNPNTPHYPTGDRDALGNDLCYWADYGRSSCDFNPHQWIYDPYTGTWY